MDAISTRLIIGLGLALGTVAATVSASPVDTKEAPPLRPGYDRCLAQAQGVTLSLNNCIGTEFDFQDRRLNTAYKSLRESLSDAGRRALRDQERAWIADRDKACAPPADGGTAAMLGANECRLNRTALRAAELEAQRIHP
ncbi:lysozyme inhibitor LprI family protein [Luteibacter sp. PPL201]|uniref:Lysozyme inhibitor LprI family protein n=1 Tax=Luteibacter sahnii TaxID=3021977 RepID=A0ABT6B7E7_9GAMM|nr:lysozyme inhibitor LprI family protein [Luteibacter sp. PPL193]MDY1548030.1 lysozyme inhibitor LprI family protein [Luteibacter sp. PPL193]